MGKNKGKGAANLRRVNAYKKWERELTREINKIEFPSLTFKFLEKHELAKSDYWNNQT